MKDGEGRADNAWVSRTRSRRLAAFALGVAVLTPLLVAVPAAAVEPPPPGGRFEYQIGGASPTLTETQIVSRDRHDSPAPGVYSICYINGFQAQPDELDWWRRLHPGLLLRHRGRLVVDQDWGEVLLDTSSAPKRRRLARIQSRWMASCAARGYRAVEFDNLDSYLRSQGRLNVRNNLALSRLLVTSAHRLGLAVAQKNAAELGRRGRVRAKFDFAIVEECQRYDECGRYERVWGRQWIEIEYSDQDPLLFAQACAERGATVSVLLRDRNIAPWGHPGYVSQWC